MRQWEYERIEELIEKIPQKELKELFDLIVEWINEKEDREEDY